jgi:hypothetical protein
MPMDGIADQRKVIELLGVQVTYHDKEFKVQMHLFLPENPSLTSLPGRG